jgi:hypothetical protein
MLLIYTPQSTIRLQYIFKFVFEEILGTFHASLKNKVIKGIFKGWSKHRTYLNFSQKTFNEMWKEKNKN